MGYNPEVHLFDYEKYITQVVPAFHKLFLTGQVEPWLAETFTACVNEMLDKTGEFSFAEVVSLISSLDLAHYCTFVNPHDLALADYASYVTNLLFLNYINFACESQSCPLRSHCFMHKTQNPDNQEGLSNLRWAVNYTFRRAVSEQCTDDQTKHSLGRSYKVGFYEQHFKNAGFAAYSHPAYTLLTALSGRGGALGFFDGGEGVLGWLDPTETVQLVDYLNQLADLPEIAPDVKAMQAAFENFTSTPSASGAGFSFNPFEDKNDTPYRFASLSLGVLRTLGQMAVERGYGLLLDAW